MAQEKEQLKIQGEKLMKKVKELLHEGNVRRIVIKNKEGKKFMEIPVTIGVIGTVIAPILAAIGALGAMTDMFIVDVVRKTEGKSTGKKASSKTSSPAKKSTTAKKTESKKKSPAKKTTSSSKKTSSKK